MRKATPMPNDTTKRGLAPFTSASRPGELYYDDQTEQVWQAIGWITQPATILENLTTGERHIEVIGCRNANRFQRVESNDHAEQDDRTSSVGSAQSRS